MTSNTNHARTLEDHVSVPFHEALAALDAVLAELSKPMVLIDRGYLMRQAEESFGCVGHVASEADRTDVAAREVVEGAKT